MKPLNAVPRRVWSLPPLILHPFSDAASPGKLLQSSRASLMLQGVLPSESLSVEQLEEMILEGRLCELRMLFYVGKDLLRWAGQCVETADREEELRGQGIDTRSFVSMLVEETPPAIQEKLAGWGVQDYRAIFMRAAGMNAVFAEVPDRFTLGTEFKRNYYYYADKMYECWLNGRTFARLRSQDFDFELYASGEYTRKLEREWAEE